ncbi:hypothetical protein vseg_015187 [Gypsophila vaccaria]
MARKSSHLRHREINLRGRNVYATHENKNMVETTETEFGSMMNCAGVIGEHTGKSKDINLLTGIPELIIESEDEEGEDTVANNLGDIPPEQRHINSETETAISEPILQI